MPDRSANPILGLGNRRRLLTSPSGARTLRWRISVGRRGARTSGANRTERRHRPPIHDEPLTGRSPGVCPAVIEQFSRAADHAAA